MNIYCRICNKEMEIIEDFGTVVKVHPCGCANDNAALRAELNHRYVVCTYCGWRLDYEADGKPAAHAAANEHALKCEADPRNVENVSLRARVDELERAMQEAKNALEPHYTISNNGTGIMAAYNILAAALAKGAG